MENRLNLTKNKKILLVCITVILCLALGLGIFIKFIRPNIVFEKNLKAVANYVFVMPDKYLENIEGATEKPLDDANPPDITTGIDENLQKYFTEKGYESFKMKWYTFCGFLVDTDYKLKVTNFEVVKDKVNHQSDFTVTTSLGKPNSETTELIFIGKARSDKNGKIEYWDLFAGTSDLFEISQKFKKQS
ncbi:MAG: hypothetical protein WAX04_08245 [Oscillospiraceae bacterium]